MSERSCPTCAGRREIDFAKGLVCPTCGRRESIFLRDIERSQSQSSDVARQYYERWQSEREMRERYEEMIQPLYEMKFAQLKDIPPAFYAMEDERDRLRIQRDFLLHAVRRTLFSLGHLADGDDCTLIILKRAFEALQTLDPTAAKGYENTVPTHTCTVCGAMWRYWPKFDTDLPDSWSLQSSGCGSCCDGHMGEHIQPLSIGGLVEWLAKQS